MVVTGNNSQQGRPGAAADGPGAWGRTAPPPLVREGNGPPAAEAGRTVLLSGQAGGTPSAAALMAPVLTRLFGGLPPLRFVFWDGSALGPGGGAELVRFRSVDALKRLMWSPNELGMARGFVEGDIDLEGDLFRVLRQAQDKLVTNWRSALATAPFAFLAASRLGALSAPPRPPAEEVRLRGWLHSKERDAAAIRHHYDVGDEFYRLVLGPAMTYSCARFEVPDASLEAAQRSKHDLVCRKLGLHERTGMRLLDVGCGWGAMALHAVQAYGARAVAITLSPSQAEYAREQARRAGVEGDLEVRLQDYRDLSDENFDAISSIGMFEHVGSTRMAEYFRVLFGLLGPRGRLLNHAISKRGGSKMRGPTFINRYVFPDGELIDLADVVAGMEGAGFEVRDVESLREHYTATLRAWVRNLDASWDRAVELVGRKRARVWRLYMAGSANNFETGVLGVHQVLGVKPALGGPSGMPATRAGWG